MDTHDTHTIVKRCFEVTNCDFNKLHYPELVGKIYFENEPLPSYAIIKETTRVFKRKIYHNGQKEK